MTKERDQFLQYVDFSDNRKEWSCKFCHHKFRGRPLRILPHLAGISCQNVRLCGKVRQEVREEAFRVFNSRGGTSGTGTEGTVSGASQSVAPSEGASNPNDVQNSNPPGCALQQPSFYPLTGAGTATAGPQDQGSLPPGDMPVDNLDNTQQRGLLNPRLDAAHGNEIASSLQQLPMGLSASSCPDFSERQALHELRTLLESETEQQNARGLSSFPNDEVCGNSMSNIGEYLSLDEHNVDGFTPDSLLDSISWSYLYESREAIVNTSEEIQTNELHNPTVGSSLQNDSSLDVDGANRLQDCGQPFMDEVVPVRSNTSPTDAVQHPGQLPPRCDKEDGNDIRQFPSRTPMDIDPSTALQHSSDSHIFEATTVDSLVPEASTNPIGPSLSHASVPRQRQSVQHQSTNLETAHQNPTVPSSSRAPNNAPPPPQILPCGTEPTDPSSLPDMNEGAPITSHQNTGNNFGERSDSKRKLEILYRKKAIIRDELEFAASLSLKKPRTEVVNWLANVEKLKNDCTETTSEDCLPSNQPVDILLHEVEDLMRQGKGLFEARETRVKELIEDKMVGKAFRRHTLEILGYLVGNQKCRLGIYGMGGVGKTTIMIHIRNKLLKEANYGDVLWITVSKDSNTQMLQDAIAEELELDKLPKKDVRKRAAMLCHCFKGRGNSTVILDDVWESFDLEEVGIPIESGGIKLVLTTRSFKVCNQMQCEKMIKIAPLSVIEAESLFFEKFGSKVALNLDNKVVVKSIVKECAGLPLAVVTMARSMRGVTSEFEWTDFLEKLRESDMGQTDMEKVLKKLEFSYNLLGDRAVQQCFLSCALYPEDELIDKFELIEFFIDQGLIGRLNTRERQYARGLTIINVLEDACLLENHEGKMKMHDLIRDMALHIMSATSIVKARKHLRTIPPEEYWTDALEKVSLMTNEIERFPLNVSPNCPKLSIFLMNTRSLFDLDIPNSFFKHLWGLKVLNLSGCRLRELPDSISYLVNLTALLLRECHELHRIPHLGKLRSLRKLDIFYCVQVEALEGLEMLVNLRYLDITHTRIERLPKGTLGALLNLECLGAGLVNGEITKLQALETLICSFDDVDDFNKFVRVVSERTNNPPYYKISVHQEQSSVHQEQSGVFEPTPVGVLFRDCQRSVNIVTRSHVIVSARGESSGSGSGICILIPQDVQNLTWNCDGATNLSDKGPLEKLEKLKINCWSNLRVLCGGQDEEVINIHDSPTRTPTPLLFRSLRELIISKCPKLKYLFGHEPKFFLPHLQRIEIWDCVEMVGIIVATTSPPLYPPPAFPSLEEIIVCRCNKMESEVESEWLPHFPNLRSLSESNLMEKEIKIGDLLIEEIHPDQLLVEGCHELPFHLRNFETIQVIDCMGMAEPIIGVGQGQEGSMTTPVNNTPSSSQSFSYLPELNSLSIHNVPQLNCICKVPKTGNSMGRLMVIRWSRLNKILMKTGGKL